MKTISVCPKCGGRIIVGEFYIYTKDYKVLLNGKLSKNPCGRSDSDTIDVLNAWCENFPTKCDVSWAADEFLYDDITGFTDRKYCNEEEGGQ